MVNDFIDIKKLTIEELSGVVSLYPWYGGARKELCRRMAELGDGAWSDGRFAEAALYVGTRRIIADLARNGRKTDCSDEDIKSLMRSCISSADTDGMEKVRESYRGVGDYFSLDSYKSVKREEDNIFASFAKSEREIASEDTAPQDDLADYYTETLAEIYLDQGYAEQAREIYSKLSLRYPEKSVYFASLIEKINKQ